MVWNIMAHMDQHSPHELQVFQEFITASKVPVALDSIEPRSPPEPDIRCRINGETVYFELGRLLDNHHQQLRNKALKIAPAHVSLDYEKVGLPERDVLIKKTSINYETSGHPLELLLYFDNENALVGSPPPPVDFEMHAFYTMQPILTPMPSHIRKVWVYERFRKAVLWFYPK